MRSRSGSESSNHSSGSSFFRFSASRSNDQFLSRYFFFEGENGQVFFGKNVQNEEGEFDFEPAEEADGVVAATLNSVVTSNEFRDVHSLMNVVQEALGRLSLPEFTHSSLRQDVAGLLSNYRSQMVETENLGNLINEVSLEDSEERLDLLQALKSEALFLSSKLFADLEKAIKDDIKAAQSRRILTEEEEEEEAKIPGVARKVKLKPGQKIGKILSILKKKWNEDHADSPIQKTVELQDLKNLMELEERAGETKWTNVLKFIGEMNGEKIYDELRKFRRPESDWVAIMMKEPLEPLEDIDAYVSQVGSLVRIFSKKESEELGGSRFFTYNISEDLVSRISVRTQKRTKTGNDEVINLGDGKVKIKNHDYDHVTAYCALLESFVASIPENYRARELSEFVVRRLNLVLAQPMDLREFAGVNIDENRRALLEKLHLTKDDERREPISNLIKRRDLRRVNAEICEISEQFLKEINGEEFSSFPQGGGSRDEGQALEIIAALNSGKKKGEISEFSQAISQIFDLKYLKLDQHLASKFDGSAKEDQMMKVARQAIERHFRVIGVAASKAICAIDDDVEFTINKVAENFLEKFLEKPRTEEDQSFYGLCSRKSFVESRDTEESLLSQNKEFLKEKCVKILRERVSEQMVTNLRPAPEVKKRESNILAVSPDGVDHNSWSPFNKEEKEDEIRDASGHSPVAKRLFSNSNGMGLK